MALIDILKLNEEIDKMIAAQETEIKQIDEQIKVDFASQWAEMIRDLWTLDDCARQLGMEIGDIYAGTMPAEKSGRCWWDTLYYLFGSDNHLSNVIAYGKIARVILQPRILFVVIPRCAECQRLFLNTGKRLRTRSMLTSRRRV